jgi:hypothetical protein
MNRRELMKCAVAGLGASTAVRPGHAFVLDDWLHGSLALTDIPETPLQVVQLGTVHNGVAVLDDAVPADWRASSGPAQQGSASARGNDIFAGFCGGHWDYEAKKLYWNGGGHAMSWNNGTYVLDAGGHGHIGGWTLLDISALGIASAARPFYADGRWCSVHTYCALARTPDGRLWRFGGSLQPSGADLACLLAFNLDGAAPVYQDYGRGDLAGSQSFFSDTLAVVGDYLFVYRPGAGQYAVFNWVTNQWTVRKRLLIPVQGVGGATMNSAFDSARQRSLCIGSITSSGGRTRHYLQYDVGGTLPTATRVELACSGATEVLSAHSPAVAYDPQNDCFWALHMTAPKAPAAVPDTRLACLYRLRWTDTATIAVEAFPLDWQGYARNVRGDGQRYDLPRGGFGKLLPLRDNNAVLMLNRLDQPVHAVRCPDP